ncbi:MAG: phage holin family protein [Verrucomicrobiota bacterium]|nr:phage holin family protein [Verrucomicrobiota bacterium]
MSFEKPDLNSPLEKNIFHRIGAGFLDILGTRIELVQLEIEEEKRRLMLAILVSVILGAFFMVGLSLVSIFIVMKLYWAYGLNSLIPVALCAFIIAGLIFHFLLRPLVSYGQTLNETVSQLKRDAQWISEQFSPKKTPTQSGRGEGGKNAQ